LAFRRAPTRGQSVRVPRGIVKLPFSLTEDTTGITLSDSVANVETEIIAYQIPRNMSVAFKPGDRFYLRLRTSVPATITSGTVRMYVADANKATKFKVLEAPVTAVYANDGNISDREQMYFLAAGFARGPDEYIIITFEGSDVADDAQTELLLEGTQFIKV